MAKALKSGRKPRADGDMTLHILEIMHGIHRSSDTGRHYKMESTCEQPKLLAEND